MRNQLWVTQRSGAVRAIEIQTAWNLELGQTRDGSDSPSGHSSGSGSPRSNRPRRTTNINHGCSIDFIDFNNASYSSRTCR